MININQFILNLASQFTKTDEWKFIKEEEFKRFKFSKKQKYLANLILK